MNLLHDLEVKFELLDLQPLAKVLYRVSISSDWRRIYDIICVTAKTHINNTDEIIIGRRRKKMAD